MRYNKVLILMVCMVCSFAGIHAASVPEVWTDTVSLPDVQVSVSRIARLASQQQMLLSVIDSRLIEETQALTPKDVSGLMPNVYMPEYGSAMTGSVLIK